MSLTNDVIEFMQGEREFIHKTAVARELARLSTCKLWPEATYKQWLAAIDEAIANKQVDHKDGNIKRATKPLEDEAPKVIQQTLF